MPATNYDEQWQLLDDFIAYNPGARHRRRISCAMLRTLRFATLLDVGCGNGALIQNILAGATAEIAATGVDFAASIVEKNSMRVPEAEFRSLDIEHEALDRRFDLVVCSEVVEHLDNQRQAMRNLAAMIEPGGHLLVTCPTGRVYNTERHFGHVSHPTIDGLDRLGREQGLTLVSSRNWGWPSYTLLKFASNVNARWALKAFAGGAYSGPKRALCQLLYWLNFLNRSDSPRGCQLFALFRKDRAD